MRQKWIGIVFVFVLALSACAKQGEFTIVDAWARPAVTGMNSAAYFIISNPTNAADTLLNASTDAASAAEVHMSMMDANGVMSMKMQENIPIPAQQEVIFKPGGLHVMLIGLKQDFKTGDTISLTLHFKNARIVTIQVPVKEK